MSQESTGIHWLLSDTNFILSSIVYKAPFIKSDVTIKRLLNLVTTILNFTVLSAFRLSASLSSLDKY